MPKLTHWTRDGARSGWWWTGKPGLLQSMGLQSVGHDWATEQQHHKQSPNATIPVGIFCLMAIKLGCKPGKAFHSPLSRPTVLTLLSSLINFILLPLASRLEVLFQAVHGPQQSLWSTGLSYGGQSELELIHTTKLKTHSYTTLGAQPEAPTCFSPQHSCRPQHLSNEPTCFTPKPEPINNPVSTSHTAVYSTPVILYPILGQPPFSN